ncbi:MAG: VWA domain-containing protein, partial [Planctomycetaceae bacterium]|nr:VWA domain-containing protein [Planctomycetaceae bacterium]
MSFAAPTAFLLTAIVLPVIALYILKVRLRRVPVSTNLFWKQVFEEKPPRALWKNLRHLFSLLAQLLLLLLLVFAVADPMLSWQALQARRIVLVIDTSASMKADDVASSRFEAARKSAHAVLDGIRFRDEVAIVTAGERPEVVLGMASHLPTLRRTLDGIQPLDGIAKLDASIDLARQLIGDHPNGQVVVFTDGCAEGDEEGVTGELKDQEQAAITAALTRDSTPDDSTAQTATTSDTALRSAPGVNPSAASAADSRSSPVSDSISIQWHQFGLAAGNVGITQFQARRSLVDPIGYEVLLSVRNASDTAVNGRVELELDGIPADVLPFELQPGQLWTRSLEKTSLEGGLLAASLVQLQVRESSGPSTAAADTGDAPTAAVISDEHRSLINALAVDDKAWAIVPPRRIR